MFKKVIISILFFIFCCILITRNQIYDSLVNNFYDEWDFLKVDTFYYRVQSKICSDYLKVEFDNLPAWIHVSKLKIEDTKKEIYPLPLLRGMRLPPVIKIKYRCNDGNGNFDPVIHEQDISTSSLEYIKGKKMALVFTFKDDAWTIKLVDKKLEVYSYD